MNNKTLTKFRAFQLDSEGSLFSYYKQDVYTLIEARIPKDGIGSLENDLNFHSKSTIDILHITSWDNDHCDYDDLVQILNKLRPSIIEIPSYEPDSDTAKLCKSTILKYENIHERYKPNLRIFSEEYFKSLPSAEKGGEINVIYQSKFDSHNKNDMSLIKLFRSNGFNVISLGDCECSSIANSLIEDEIFCNEIDILILPHHGADNGFLSPEFLEKIKPRIAICSSNFGNKYEHPKREIKNMLTNADVPLKTTKTGDIIIYQEQNSKEAIVVNFTSNNDDREEPIRFIPKKHALAQV